MTSRKQPNYGLEYLLAFDGRIHYLEQGYWLKFEITHGQRTAKRPHGLTYAFTLHAPDGRRILGFDNAHGVDPQGSRYKQRPQAHDHWHRSEGDEGRPYAFKDAETLIEDFFTEVERVLTELGISPIVVAEESVRK